MKKYADSICEKPFHKPTKKKVSVTISDVNHERLEVLSEFGPEILPISWWIDRAITELLAKKEVRQELEEAYERWKQKD